MFEHTHSYIICATPRSGSTLLCDLLTDTGVAGRPDSFFNFEVFDWAGYFNLSAANWNKKDEFDRSYLSAVHQYGTNGTSVFGMRLMWENLDSLCKRLNAIYPNLPSDSARFQSAFGTSLYLHLTREDKIAQAVSLLKAEQSGLWHVNADGTERERLKSAETPVYDSSELSKYIAELKQHDEAWMRWFDEQDIQPLHISYEALSVEPQVVIATILSSLGLDPTIAAAVEPRTAKLANSDSREWITRFQTDITNDS